VLGVTPRQRISYAVVSWLLAVLLGALALHIMTQLMLDRLSPGWFWVAVVTVVGALSWLLYALYQMARWAVGEIFSEAQGRAQTRTQSTSMVSSAGFGPHDVQGP
jgi:hypothetical protein